MEVLYEDNHVIGVVKPYNVPVQEHSSGVEELLSLVKVTLKTVRSYQIRMQFKKSVIRCGARTKIRTRREGQTTGFMVVQT